MVYFLLDKSTWALQIVILRAFLLAEYWYDFFSFRGSWTLNVNITGRTLIIQHCIAHFLQNALTHFETKIQPYHFRKYIVMNMNYERKFMPQRITIKYLNFQTASFCYFSIKHPRRCRRLQPVIFYILDAELQSFKKWTSCFKNVF